jgi:hypothetical protein
VPFPAPTFLAAHGVLQLANPAQRDPARDEAFIAAVRNEFPNVINRTLLPLEAPVLAPHITLASTSSQLAVSSAQADFEVRFYGDYLADIQRGLEYVERKLDTVLSGFHATGNPVAMIGLIATLHFSFKEMEGDGPAAHVLRTHLRTQVEPSEVQDALARVALKLRDTYFVTLTLSNYESRVLERPLMPGLSVLRIRPWEGRVDDFGLELVIDINNNLEARASEADPVVTSDGVRAVVGVLREVATSSGPDFAETGKVSAETLTLSSTP